MDTDIPYVSSWFTDHFEMENLYFASVFVCLIISSFCDQKFITAEFGEVLHFQEIFEGFIEYDAYMQVLGKR